MLVFPSVTVERGPLANDGANVPPMPVDNANIWTQQLIERAIVPRPLVPPTPTPVPTVTAYQPPRTFTPDTPATVPPPTDTGGGWVPVDRNRSPSGGVTIDPNPSPLPATTSDPTRTPTPINQVTGGRIPAPTTPTVQASPTAVVAKAPAFTRQQIIIALAVVGVLLLLD